MGRWDLSTLRTLPGDWSNSDGVEAGDRVLDVATGTGAVL